MIHTTIQNVKPFKAKSSQEERFLIYEAQNGCDESRGKLIEGNIKLAIKIANKFSHTNQDLDDLVGEGILGLHESIKKFDLTKNNKFCTFASWHILNKISAFSKSNSKSVYFPFYLKTAAISVSKYRTKYITENGVAPDFDHLCETFKYKSGKMAKILSFFCLESSLDSRIGEDDENSLFDVIDSNNAFNIKEESNNDSLNKIFNVISPEAKEILEFNYGIIGGKKLSYKEIGEKFNKSKKEVSEIINKSKLSLFEALKNNGKYKNF